MIIRATDLTCSITRFLTYGSNIPIACLKVTFILPAACCRVANYSSFILLQKIISIFIRRTLAIKLILYNRIYTLVFKYLFLLLLNCLRNSLGFSICVLVIHNMTTNGTNAIAMGIMISEMKIHHHKEK